MEPPRAVDGIRPFIVRVGPTAIGWVLDLIAVTDLLRDSEDEMHDPIEGAVRFGGAEVLAEQSSSRDRAWMSTTYALPIELAFNAAAASA